MNKRQASEWVHRQLIVDELDAEQLVAVFSALCGHPPDAVDRENGLFRRCCELVLEASPVAPPTAEPALAGHRSGGRAGRA